MFIAPPKGDHAASPVSSYRTNNMFGESFGALAGTNGSQSATESLTSSFITPLNVFLGIVLILSKKSLFIKI